jgi:hypothetical protein
MNWNKQGPFISKSLITHQTWSSFCFILYHATSGNEADNEMTYKKSITPSFCFCLGGQLSICETIFQLQKLCNVSGIGDNVCRVIGTMIWLRENAMIPEERWLIAVWQWHITHRPTPLIHRSVYLAETKHVLQQLTFICINYSNSCKANLIGIKSFIFWDITQYNPLMATYVSEQHVTSIFMVKE